MKAQFLEGKTVGQVFLHPAHACKAPTKQVKQDKRTWKQRLQFAVFCARATDKFWRS